MNSEIQILTEEIGRMKSLFTEERLYGNLVEQQEKELFFACTRSYLGDDEESYCIDYGGVWTCGKYTMAPYTKEWRGINKFNEGQVYWPIMDDTGTLVEEGITGKLFFLLKIYPDRNGFTELTFSWWDSEWARTLAKLQYLGSFECGDNNELLFTLKFEKAQIVDFSTGDPEVIDDITDVRLKEFVGKWIEQANVGTVVSGLGDPSTEKLFTGEQLKTFIEGMMKMGNDVE